MRKEKFLTVAVAFLFVLNTGIIGYLFLTRQPHPPELWKIVVHETGFDEQQRQRYFSLRDNHRKNMDQLNARFAETLRQYLDQLRTDADTLEADSLSRQLAFIEKQKAELTLRHFRAVKALCRPDQQQAFNSIIPKLTTVLLPPKRDLPPPRK